MNTSPQEAKAQEQELHVRLHNAIAKNHENLMGIRGRLAYLMDKITQETSSPGQSPISEIDEKISLVSVLNLESFTNEDEVTSDINNLIDNLTIKLFKV